MASKTIKVFISFRGLNCRHGILSHLCAELNRHNLIILVDEGFKRGNYIDSEIERSIEQSKISIAIISEDYANSVACLDELVMMLQRLETEGNAYMLLPVYYHVTEEEVKTQTGSFAKALVEMGKIFAAQRVKKWRTALTKVADLNGRVVLPNEPENTVCCLIAEDVLSHVDWLNSEEYRTRYEADAIEQIVLEQSQILRGCGYSAANILTSSEKSSGIEASIECSKKLIELGSKGTIECLALKGNRNEGGCIKIEGFESQISPPPNSNFRGSLEKLISGEANNCKSDDSRRKNRGSILVSSSKQGSFNKSILKALQEHQAFFSQDLEFGSQNLGDLSNSFQIVKGLTEDDGINIVEKRQLSILESESAAVIEQIRSFAKGRKEVELEIQKLDQGKKEMEKCYRMMESHGEYLKSEMTPAKIQEFYRSIEFLKSIFVEPENSRDVKLHEQKVRLEELEQQGRQGLHSLQQFINGLIYKFQELAGRDC